MPATAPAQSALISKWNAKSVLLLFGIGWSLALLGTALAFIIRRVQDAFAFDLTTEKMILALIGLSCILLLWRMLGAAVRKVQAQYNPPFDFELSLALLGSLCVFSVAWAISLPETSVSALAVLWVGLGFQEGVFWGKRVPFKLATVPQTPMHSQNESVAPSPEVCESEEPPQETPTETSLEAMLLAAADQVEADHEEVEGESDGAISRQTRYRTETEEQVVGWCEVSFAAGQRTASAHIGFCPPLPSTPEIEAEITQGEEVRLTSKQTLLHGAGWELKRTGSAEAPATVRFEFCAVASFQAEQETRQDEPLRQAG
ncbi:Hypothetical protein PBC10988_30990 [Planctomycetales bacterium 10988]|nr:Hypothetical protein PBC10988_30990 [Planctomycetales bacterium 10988]